MMLSTEFELEDLMSALSESDLEAEAPASQKSARGDGSMSLIATVSN